MMTTITSAQIRFMDDWKADHRPLSDEQRDAVANYIAAIVGLKGEAIGEMEAADTALDLWVRFRTTYDGLRDYRPKTDREDFVKSMRNL